MRYAIFFFCAAAAPLLMAATQPVRLQPSGPWVVDYAENSCRLIRTFGEGRDKTVLGLESESPDEVDMLVAGKPLAGYSEDVPARFLPVQRKPIEGRAGQSADRRQPAILWSRVDLLPDDLAERIKKRAADRRARPGIRPPAVDVGERALIKAKRQEFASNAIELEIAARSNRPVILETGSLGNAIKMFDKCSRDSLRDWGVDPDIEDKIVRPLWAPNPAKWFTSNDYPPDMVVRGEESIVKVRLLVDATGKPTKCTSLSHFKEPSFNDVVCVKFMKRAHFEPAELADGTKVPSFYTNIIVFQMYR
jgi:hypothetical protein